MSKALGTTVDSNSRPGEDIFGCSQGTQISLNDQSNELNQSRISASPAPNHCPERSRCPDRAKLLLLHWKLSDYQHVPFAHPNQATAAATELQPPQSLLRSVDCTLLESGTAFFPTQLPADLHLPCWGPRPASEHQPANGRRTAGETATRTGCAVRSVRLSAHVELDGDRVASIGNDPQWSAELPGFWRPLRPATQAMGRYSGEIVGSRLDTTLGTGSMVELHHEVSLGGGSAPRQTPPSLVC